MSPSTVRPDGVRVPPDERFWERYSPHHEAPLSGVGSFALHFLIAGFLLLAGYLGWLGLGGRSTPPSLDVVRVDDAGGGGARGKEEKGPGNGAIGGPEEVAKPDRPADEVQKPGDNPKRPDLPPPVPGPQEPQPVPVNSNPERFLQVGAKSAEDLSKLGLDAGKMLRDGPQPAGVGKGGPGSRGGDGPGAGPGDGPGKREGRIALTQRQKRMIRWTLRFQNRTGDEYVRQLAGLGAILAIPKDRDGTSYWVIRDLAHRPAKLLGEDIYDLDRIFWNNTRPEDVAPVLQALGVSVRARHFVAFMPRELEEKLAADELRWQGLREDEILETVFDVKFKDGKYVAEVAVQRRK